MLCNRFKPEAYATSHIIVFCIVKLRACTTRQIMVMLSHKAQLAEPNLIFFFQLLVSVLTLTFNFFLPSEFWTCLKHIHTHLVYLIAAYAHRKWHFFSFS